MITVQTLGSSSKGNAYRLRSGSRSLLLECGLPWKEIRRKLNFETSELDGCLVTHAHGDHFKAARDLMANGIDVYASMDTFEWGAVSPNHHRAKQFHPPYYSFIVQDYWEVVPFELRNY